ncbi:MAG: CoA pyrophosphatase [Gammaproteobacteria bacterium]|nr:CoA pyrophosphatase [Gammaproteobacteria bacterium]
MLTVQELTRRLSGTALPDSPTDIVMPPGSSGWPAGMRDQLSGQLTPAGVLIPIVERGSDLTVILTQRSAALKHHAGQVSFPGGRMESHDADVAATALRETHEEIGIAPGHVSIVGYVQTMPTITGYAVTPIVGVVSPAAELQIDRSEVEYTFEVPLPFLLDTANELPVEREVSGQKMRMTEFHWGGERIWGATAFMILELGKILKKQ